MELNIEELQYLLNAIDTHVRANGIQGAGVAVVIVNKLQADAKEAGEKLAKTPSDGGAPSED